VPASLHRLRCDPTFCPSGFRRFRPIFGRSSDKSDLSAETVAAQLLRSTRAMDERSVRPWNWCDRRCERCPLSMECSVNVRVEQRKRDAIEQGLDPEDPNVVMGMVTESFLEAIRSLAEELPDEPDEPVPELGANELYQAGLRYCRAVESLGRGDGLLSEARLVSMILMCKTARLADGLPLQRNAIAREDTVLTLLLIDRLEKQAAALVMAAGAEWTGGRMFGYRRARRELRGVLDMHLERIDRSERDFVDRMVARGRAPSPFCLAIGPPMRAA